MVRNLLDIVPELLAEWHLSRKTGSVSVRVVLHRGGVRKIVINNDAGPDKNWALDCRTPPRPSL